MAQKLGCGQKSVENDALQLQTSQTLKLSLSTHSENISGLKH
jgi:hypothetical protein